jgi:hypothetical protein
MLGNCYVLDNLLKFVLYHDYISLILCQPIKYSGSAVIFNGIRRNSRDI